MRPERVKYINDSKRLVEIAISILNDISGSNYTTKDIELAAKTSSGYRDPSLKSGIQDIDYLKSLVVLMEMAQRKVG